MVCDLYSPNEIKDVEAFSVFLSALSFFILSSFALPLVYEKLESGIAS